MKLKHDELLSNFAFEFNLRHYNTEDAMTFLDAAYGMRFQMTHPNVKTKEPLFEDLQVMALLEVDVEYAKEDFTFRIAGQMQYDKFNSLSTAGLRTLILNPNP